MGLVSFSLFLLIFFLFSPLTMCFQIGCLQAHWFFCLMNSAADVFCFMFHFVCYTFQLQDLFVFLIISIDLMNVSDKFLNCFSVFSWSLLSFVITAIFEFFVCQIAGTSFCPFRETIFSRLFLLLIDIGLCLLIVELGICFSLPCLDLFVTLLFQWAYAEIVSRLTIVYYFSTRGPPKSKLDPNPTLTLPKIHCPNCVGPGTPTKGPPDGVGKPVRLSSPEVLWTMLPTVQHKQHIWCIISSGRDGEPLPNLSTWLLLEPPPSLSLASLMCFSPVGTWYSQCSP